MHAIYPNATVVVHPKPAESKCYSSATEKWIINSKGSTKTLRLASACLANLFKGINI